MVKALVVEDNPGIREVIVDLLRRRGHEVVAFADAESAWETTQHEIYPVTVLDWGLPGMDGVTLCRRLRARPGGDAGAILLLTGRADPEDIDEVVAAGADDYLTKPFKLEWLEVRIAFAERKSVDLAERARTAAALRRSEARFRSLVQNASDIISVLDADGVRTYISPSVQKVLGYAPEALIGVDYLDDPIRTAEDRERAARLFKDALANPGRPIIAEIGALTADGVPRLFEVIATNLLDDPDVGGIVLNARDITDRRRAEEERAASEVKYRSLVERLPVIAYIESTQHELLYISPQVELLFGWTAAELLTGKVDRWELLHPDDAEALRAEDRRTSETEEPFRAEYRARTRAGHYVWLRDEAILVRDDHGQPLYWHGVVADVTERRRAEEALRESERRHRELALAAARQAIELHLLHEVRTALAQAWEPAVIFRTVVEAIAKTFGYTLVSLYLVEDGVLVLQHQVGYHRTLDRIPLSRGVMSRVVRTGQPILLTDSASDPEFLAAFDGITSEVCVPLRDNGQVIGVLNLETTGDETLTEADLRLTLALAEHIETALSRARLYAEARESERRYRSVVEAVHEVIFQADASGAWTFLNPAWTEITGYPVADSLGRPATDFVHPEDREQIMQCMRRMMTREIAYSRHELRFLTAAGDVRWLEAHSRATTDASGNVIGISGTLTDVTERRRAEEALRESQERYRHLALHDPLTGLPNRALFLDRLEHAVASSARRQTEVAVLFLDLDGFKLVNDSLGHEAGDRLLVGVGQRLSACLRAADTIARLGGDEFAILLEDHANAHDVELIARRLLEALRPPFLLDGTEISIGASIGVALGWQGAVRPADLLRNADLALYEAKGAGRGTYAVYEPRMATTLLTRMKQKADLRRALDCGQLRLHYQPVFDLQTSAVASVEALIRWDHPEHGLLPPSEFFRAAESNGLAVQLGAWVLGEACRQAKRWQTDAGAAARPVGVNLSARQLQEPSFVDLVGETLTETRLDPALLELEITESVVMMGGTRALRTIEALKQLGVRLAIDDFGTGSASFGYLREVPVDAVKIDRSLIGGLGRDRASLAIVRAITLLAHELGAVVTAEGIETREQHALVCTLGVDHGQGYYFARPLPADWIDALLAGNTSISTALFAKRAVDRRLSAVSP